jgi:hypothetical protein
MGCCFSSALEDATRENPTSNVETEEQYEKRLVNNLNHDEMADGIIQWVTHGEEVGAHFVVKRKSDDERLAYKDLFPEFVRRPSDEWYRNLDKK